MIIPFTILSINCRGNGNGLEAGDTLSRGKSAEDSEREFAIVVNGINTVMMKNVTAKRLQDSEADNAHLEGYGGNVNRHPQHVFFETDKPLNTMANARLSSCSESQGTMSSCNKVKKITLPEIEMANKEPMAMGIPRIMEQNLGPTTLGIMR